MSSRVKQIFEELGNLHEEKGKQYGEQATLLSEILSKIASHFDFDVNEDNIGDMHFSTELLCKYLRYMNIRYGKSLSNLTKAERLRKCDDSLRDMAVYAVMLLDKFEKVIEKDEPKF